MNPRLRDRALRFALAFALTTPPLALAADAPTQALGRAFGGPVVLFAVGTGAPEALVRVLQEIEAIERALAAPPLADGAPHIVDSARLDVAEKGKALCLWSEGLLAPFGFGPPLPPLGKPGDPQLDLPPVCERARVDLAAKTLALAPEAVLDTTELAAGYAVDRAIEAMQAEGLATGFAAIGRVQRAYGTGPEGRGWRSLLPETVTRLDPEMTPPYLRDRALAVATSDDVPPHVDARSGQPVDKPGAVLVAFGSAADAQAIAAAMLLLGSRGGELRLGSLQPEPAVLWILGTGEGTPLLIEHRWRNFTRR